VPADDADACRAIADRIDRDRRYWIVLWGCYSRQFVAFPLFDTPGRLLVHAGFPDALVARMDEVERRYRRSPARRSGPGRGPGA
jgi:hypothetical protein